MSAWQAGALEIKTPEGIVFRLPLAGPVTRFFAWAIDLAAVSLVTSLAGSLLSLLNVLSPDLTQALTLLCYFAASISYGILLEWFWRGQTLGKRLLGLRVVDQAGLRLRFSQVVIRNLLRFVDALPAFYLVGGAVCLATRRSQRLGDYAANTVVVRRESGALSALETLGSKPFNSLRAHPHLLARLRQRLSPEQARLALQALVRRHELDPAARVALFRELAAHCQSLVSFPEEATLGLSDEQYVRNVVEALFQPERRRE